MSGLTVYAFMRSHRLAVRGSRGAWPCAPTQTAKPDRGFNQIVGRAGCSWQAVNLIRPIPMVASRLTADSQKPSAQSSALYLNPFINYDYQKCPLE